MANIVNTIKLDYPLFRYASDGYTREIDFYGGFFFPDNEEIDIAIWDLGDGTVFEQTFSDLPGEVERFDKTLSSMLRYTGSEPLFFPKWRVFQEQIGSLGIPKFRLRHNYPEDGEYEARLTLVKNDGTAYIGTTTKIQVQRKQLEYKRPVNWDDITEEYTLTDNTDLLFNVGNNTNYITLESEVIDNSGGSFIVDFSLKNAIGRADIQYIEWVFGDGTTHVQHIGIGVEVDESLAKFRYDYKLLPTTLTYEPTVILHLVRNGKKYKITIKGNDVAIQNRVETVVSYEMESLSIALEQRDEVDTYAFNATPAESIGLPEETKFTIGVVKELQYVIWKFGDGTYDITPVKYFNQGGHVKQTLELTRRYIAPNYDCVPECIFVYNVPGYGYQTQRFRALRPLLYDRGFNTTNYYDTIEDITSYTRNLNIHVFADYIDDQSCTLHVRATSSDDPAADFQDIGLFSKLSWNVGGRTFIQDKNTTQNFGYAVVENFPTPEEANVIDIAVDVYGEAADFEGSVAVDNSRELVLYGRYSFLDVLVLNKTTQETETQEERDFLAREPGRILYGGALQNLSPSAFVEETGAVVTPIATASVNDIPRRLEGLITRSVVGFDKLFSADDPPANFLNRDHPSTVSTRTGSRVQERDIGFFTPSKTAIILVEPGIFNFNVSLNQDTDYTKPYYFPNPFIYGSDTDILDFNVDVNSFHKGYGFGRAYTEPNTADNFITFYGYTSRPSSSNNRDLSFVVNGGYVDDAKTDLHGNMFGLFKDVSIPTSSNQVRVPGAGDALVPTFLLINGYSFYDSYFGQGFNFNYGTVYNSGEIRIPGWGAGIRTGDFNDKPLTTISFGRFTSNLEVVWNTPIEINTVCTNPRPIDTVYCENGFFVKGDGTPVLDPISSDLSSWPGDGNYYYTQLFEAGAHVADPYVKPTTDTAERASFLQSVRSLNGNEVFDADACYFMTDLPNNFDVLFNRPGLQLLDADANRSTMLLATSSTKSASLIERTNQPGVMYVKQINRKSDTFVNSLPYLSRKYDATVYNDMSANTIAFDMLYNSYIIQTKNRLIIDEVKYVNGGFVDPGTSNIHIEYNQTPFNKISNRFKVGGDVYFAMLSSINVDTTNIAILPRVYKYSTKYKKLTEVTLGEYDINSFVVDDLSSLYIEVGEVDLTYNEQISRFHLTYTLKDANKLPHIIAMNFAEYDSIDIKSAVSEKVGGSLYESFVDDSYLTNFQTAVSSNTPVLCSCNLGPTRCLIL